MIEKQLIMNKLEEYNFISKTNFIFLYGSVSRNEATPLSDVDICISLYLPQKDRFRARIKLMGVLPEKYDVTIFEDLPLYVQRDVFKGVLLYCKSKKKVIERALQVIRDFEDFKPVYDCYITRADFRLVEA